MKYANFPSLSGAIGGEASAPADTTSPQMAIKPPSSTVPAAPLPESSLKVTARDFVPSEVKTSMPVIRFAPSFPSSKPVQKPYTPNPQQINGKKCHDFYRGNKLCERGDTCIYRHEFRTFSQVQRRYYTTHFMAYEALYDNMLSYKTKDSFLENLESTENYEPQTSRLSVFTDIRRPNNNETHNKVRDVNMTLVEEGAIYGEG